MSAEPRTDPYANCNFLVEVDSLVVAGFSEVSGLDVEMQPEEYQEGGVNEFTHKLPGRYDYPNAVLRRGLTDSRTLWDWANDTADDVGNGTLTRKNVRVILLDSVGSETWGWEFQEAYPVKWTGPEFGADQGSVAIESVELVHRGISNIPGRPPE
ncbi:phage tail protein [Haladaptatus sp. DFWS20]|uniref:phage tail protein n=1 Tax=Haladaptatus sp. DFWS20 TaxID=3403467 RepID=UPI003EBAE5ED